MSSPPAEVLERLYRLAPRGMLFGLERMQAACATMGHPERDFRSLHIAGTNGKGSVAAMTAAMARASGVRVGLYTSPHLCRFSERIQLDGEPVREGVVYPIIEEVLDHCPDLTFFEAATLAAFLTLAREGVELAVVEVGLGGRLDATNVLEAPVATAITRIALDHTDRLGPDLASVAGEKAGILKRGVPAILGPLHPVALARVLEVARTVGAEVVLTDADRELASFVRDHPPALAGAHQIENAKIAIALARRADLPTSGISAGLRQVRWLGRLESLRTAEGDILLDAAHNPDGAQALAAELRARGTAPAQVALVFGAMADKDYPGMLTCLAPLAAHRVYVAPEGRRPADPVDLARVAPGVLAKDIGHALDVGRKAVGREGLVVVAGSIFLVGAARAHLLGLQRDPVVAL